MLRRILASLQFAILSAGQNFRRNLAVSLAGVLTMGLILVMVGGTLLGTHILNGILTVEQSRASTLRIYLADGSSLASITNLESQLQHDPKILSVQFTNKDQAANDARQIPIFAQSLNALGNNPLPASLNLKVAKLRDVPTLSSQATHIALVDPNEPTDFNQDVIRKLQQLIVGIQIVAIVISVVLGFISLVIIMNTIRTAVFLRRREIEIMKLVGATDWFVRWPFILEGVIGGLLAAVLASILLVPAYNFATSAIRHTPDLYWLWPLSQGESGTYTLGLLALLMLAGMGLGAFGSYLGVRRFLTT